MKMFSSTCEGATLQIYHRLHTIWNAAFAAFQFWMADLDPQILSNAIEWVYTAFFCSNSA